jgi:hypothetical protein
MWTRIVLRMVLFMIMVPGVHLSIPPGASIREQALIHGIVYSLALHLIERNVEMFDVYHPNSKSFPKCPPNSVQCPSGECRLTSDLYGFCPP